MLEPRCCLETWQHKVFFSHKNLHTASVKAVGEVWLWTTITWYFNQAVLRVYLLCVYLLCVSSPCCLWHRNFLRPSLTIRCCRGTVDMGKNICGNVKNTLVEDGSCCLNFFCLKFLCSQLQWVSCSNCTFHGRFSNECHLQPCFGVFIIFVPLLSRSAGTGSQGGTATPEYHYPELLFHVVTGGIIFPSSMCKNRSV